MSLFLHIFSVLSRHIATIAVLLLICVVFANVITRYFFSYTIIALQELEWYFFSISFLFASAFALAENAHVRVDVWYARFRPATQHLVDIAGLVVLGLPMAAVLIWGSIDFVSYAFEWNEHSADPGGLPYMFIPKSFLPAAMALLLAQILVQLVQHVRLLIQKTDEGPSA